MMTASVCADVVQKTYQPTPQAFPNPERGFQWTNLPNFAQNSTRPLNPTVLAGLRDQNITIVSQMVVMANYVNQDFDQAFLNSLQQTFAAARAHGLKVSLRMAYNWNQNISQSDASLEQGKRHLQQLAPVFADNQDVLAFLELGFIGRYGEWWGSTAGHIKPGTVNLTTSGVQFTQAILEAIPQTRMASVRYVKQFADVFGGLNPVTPSEAYGPSHRARLAVIDHAIAYDGGSSVGTFDPNPTIRAQEQAFLEAHTRYTVSGGEPYANSAYFQQNILNYARRFHMSFMSVNQSDGVATGLYDEMKTNGNYAELDRRMGYRYRLIEASVPAQVGDSLALDLTMANDGFARPFNPRALELVLRDAQGQNTRIPFDSPQDLRLFLPGPEETKSIRLDFDLTGLTPGVYELLLNLPDPAPTLTDDPRYSIRLANEHVWESTTGYNHLGLSITVVPEPTTAATLLGGFVLASIRPRKRRS